MPCSFHPHLHPSFVLVFSSHQCENAQETFTTMGLFAHLLLIRGFESSLEAYSSRRADCILPHISKHFHKSGPWHALHSVTGPRRACTVQLWNTYTEGLPSWFRWMDGHQASIQALMYGVQGSWREAEKLFRIYEARFEWWLGGFGGRLLVVWGFRVTGLRLQSAIMLLSKSLYCNEKQISAICTRGMGETDTWCPSCPSLLFDPLLPCWLFFPLNLWFNLLSGFCFMHLPRLFLTHQYKQWKTTNGLICFSLWSAGLQMSLRGKTRWMLVPLNRSSRRTALNSRCCLGCHILAVIPLQCHVRLCVCDRWIGTTWDGEKMAWGNFPSHVALVILIILCLRVIFKGPDIYSVSPFRSFPIKASQASFCWHVYRHYLFCQLVWVLWSRVYIQ